MEMEEMEDKIMMKTLQIQKPQRFLSWIKIFHFFFSSIHVRFANRIKTSSVRMQAKYFVPLNKKKSDKELKLFSSSSPSPNFALT